MEADKANKILTALETTEANIVKLERLWVRIEAKIPEGLAFMSDPDYDDLRRQYAEVVASLPAIGGVRIQDSTADLNDIAQSRLDTLEIDEIHAQVSVDEWIAKPGRDIAEYRFRLRKKRRELVLELAKELIDQFDATLVSAIAARPSEANENGSAPDQAIETLKRVVAQLERLLGTFAKRPERWADLRRHLGFATWLDVADIQRLDWPVVRPAILGCLYGENDPLPVSVADLDSLEELPADAPVPTALAFDALGPDAFERLIFSLVSNEVRYENPQWLMRTSAPDRGRDVSVQRVIEDSLGGTRRERVIIQCKHWQENSVGLAELATLLQQVKLWDSPRVDVLVIATSGRFSADAVLAIEKHNDSGAPPRVEMWPDSHLELLLARRPILIAEFGLRPDAPAV
jgi:hypothetical protein